jgi:hypothetical protein
MAGRLFWLRSLVLVLVRAWQEAGCRAGVRLGTWCRWWRHAAMDGSSRLSASCWSSAKKLWMSTRRALALGDAQEDDDSHHGHLARTATERRRRRASQGGRWLPVKIGNVMRTYRKRERDEGRHSEAYYCRETFVRQPARVDGEVVVGDYGCGRWVLFSARTDTYERNSKARAAPGGLDARTATGARVW